MHYPGRQGHDNFCYQAIALIEGFLSVMAMLQQARSLSRLAEAMRGLLR